MLRDQCGFSMNKKKFRTIQSFANILCYLRFLSESLWYRRYFLRPFTFRYSWTTFLLFRDIEPLKFAPIRTQNTNTCTYIYFWHGYLHFHFLCCAFFFLLIRMFVIVVWRWLWRWVLLLLLLFFGS
jgi:hypothetical protein